MARAIVRYSINGEGDNYTGNQARGALNAVGFDKIGTAAYEADGRKPQTLSLAYASYYKSLRIHLAAEDSITFGSTWTRRTANGEFKLTHYPVFEYIEGFYNTRRRHSTLNHKSPADHESLCHVESH